MMLVEQTKLSRDYESELTAKAIWRAGKDDRQPFFQSHLYIFVENVSILSILTFLLF